MRSRNALTHQYGVMLKTATPQTATPQTAKPTETGTGMDTGPLEIKKTALGLLARREHSRHELSSKLARKYADTSQIEKQLDALAESGVQSDERFVEAFVRFKKGTGKGPNYIRQELKQRGVSEFLIASYVYEQDEDWQELASTVYEKKFGMTVAQDKKERAKRIRFMVSRGFSADSAFRLLNDHEAVD